MITDETEPTNNNQLQTPLEISNQFKDLSWSDATHDNQGFWSVADVNFVSTTTTQEDLISTPVENPNRQRNKQNSNNSTKIPLLEKTRTNDIEPEIVKEHDSNAKQNPNQIDLKIKKTRTIVIELKIVKEHNPNAQQNPNQTNQKIEKTRTTDIEPKIENSMTQMQNKIPIKQI